MLKMLYSYSLLDIPGSLDNVTLVVEDGVHLVTLDGVARQSRYWRWGWYLPSCCYLSPTCNYNK